MGNLVDDLEYNLDHLKNLCGFEAHNFMGWQNVLKLSEQVVAYIVSTRRRGEKILSADPRIRVSTIHRAKGGEADNVAILMDSTKACVESEDQDAERESMVCWYDKRANNIKIRRYGFDLENL